MCAGGIDVAVIAFAILVTVVLLLQFTCIPVLLLILRYFS